MKLFQREDNVRFNLLIRDNNSSNYQYHVILPILLFYFCANEKLDYFGAFPHLASSTLDHNKQRDTTALIAQQYGVVVCLCVLNFSATRKCQSKLKGKILIDIITRQYDPCSRIMNDICVNTS